MDARSALPRAAGPAPGLALALAAWLVLLAGSPALAADPYGTGQARQDETTGWLDQGMSAGTDPRTGDTVYQVGARPKAQQTAPAIVGPPIVVPEVRPGPRSGGGSSAKPYPVPRGGN
jgi:hypothetical protein